MLQILHNAVCWLLSAVLLLTNGLPLAVQHAHDVGDDAYHHSHQPGRYCQTCATPSVCDGDSTVAAVTEHVHLLWLGWELTILPPKGGRPVSAPSLGGSGLLAKLDARSDALCDCLSLTGDLSSLPALQRADSPGIVRHAMQPRALAALPLCDTARHLRSGVQLI
jgi:hypothetical protein